jgi:hypothetical protein
MGIEFGTIHNLLRTYQHVLKLAYADAGSTAGTGAAHGRL